MSCPSPGLAISSHLIPSAEPTPPPTPGPAPSAGRESCLSGSRGSSSSPACHEVLGREGRSGWPEEGPLPSIPQALHSQPHTLPAVRVCVHLSHQGPVLIDSCPRFRSQVQKWAGAAATASTDPLDDLGVGVGQLGQRSSQLLLVSADVTVSESAGHTAMHPCNPSLCPGMPASLVIRSQGPPSTGGSAVSE